MLVTITLKKPPGISSSPCVLEAILGRTQQKRVAGPTGPALAPCCCPGWAVPPAVYPEWAILRDPCPTPSQSSAGTAPPSGSPQTHSREEPDHGYEESQEGAIEGQRNIERHVRQNVCKHHVSNEQWNLTRIVSSLLLLHKSCKRNVFQDDFVHVIQHFLLIPLQPPY